MSDPKDKKGGDKKGGTALRTEDVTFDPDAAMDKDTWLDALDEIGEDVAGEGEAAVRPPKGRLH